MLADDLDKRRFNQAIFKRMLVNDDLTLKVEYAGPYDIIRARFEKFIQKTEKPDGVTTPAWFLRA